MTNEEARKKASDIYMRWATNEGRRTEHLIESIAQALAVPAGCVRDENGVDRKVLGELVTTEDGCVCGHKAKVYPLHPLPDYPDDHGEIVFTLRDAASGEMYDESEASPGKCFSTREAASSALSSTEKK